MTRIRILRVFVIAALIVVCGAGRLLAQTPVTNPTALEFTPSTDHAAVVTEYRALYYPATACNPTCPTTTPAFTINLGKPSPVANKITVTNIFGGLVLGTSYKAVVVAVGPGGVSAYSLASGPFSQAPAAVVPAPVAGPVVVR